MELPGGERCSMHTFIWQFPFLISPGTSPKKMGTLSSNTDYDCTQSFCPRFTALRVFPPTKRLRVLKIPSNSIHKQGSKSVPGFVYGASPRVSKWTSSTSFNPLALAVYTIRLHRGTHITERIQKSERRTGTKMNPYLYNYFRYEAKRDRHS